MDKKERYIARFLNIDTKVYILHSSDVSYVCRYKRKHPDGLATHKYVTIDKNELNNFIFKENFKKI